MIEVENLTKRYRDVVAVDRVSFTVRPGRVTGFLGPNGAGKSTTMRMILGLDAPDAGRVRIGGVPYPLLATPLQVVGALLDAKAADPSRSARNHLLWLARAGGIDTGRVDVLLELVGLSDVATRRVGKFSLGMHQRLGIAAALLGDPPVVMFDEPINGLDPDGIIWLRRLMRQLADEGRTVFLSSHLMSEMALTADHLVVIGKGRIVADAPLDTILSTHASASVTVRAEPRADLAFHLQRHGARVEEQDDGSLTVLELDAAAIGRIAMAEGIALRELTPRSTTLEEAFLELTHDVTDFHADHQARAHARSGS